MEFGEKLQQLRKQKELTQEELAGLLYVSRTAVSKWESGRGYPNLESLKGIAAAFSVTVDELLSGEELLTLAVQDAQRHKRRVRELVFGLMDSGAALLLFLPFFAQKGQDAPLAVSLLSLTTVTLVLCIVGSQPYAAVFVLVFLMTKALLLLNRT